MSPYEQVVYDLAEACVRRVVNKSVRQLQALPGERMSDALGSVWEEICVQVQGEHSVFWSAYEHAMDRVVAAALDALKPYELRAMWLQTDAGMEWSCADEAQNAVAPIGTDEVVDYVRQELLSRAADWTNPQIRAVLDGSIPD